jgi:tetratricopeptide (TPR) repeat protein
MRHQYLKGAVVLLLATFLFQGYQCGSPEFTGAKVHMQQKNYKEAIRLLELEVEKNPTNAEAWYLLGGLKADEGDYEGMNKAFNEALKLSQQHAAEIRAIRYNNWGQNLNLGVMYLEKASPDSAEYYEKSINAFKKSIASWPDTGLTYKYLAYAYNNKGDLANALENYAKAWELDQDVEALKRIGRIYIVRAEEHKTKFETVNAEKLKKWKTVESVKKMSNKSDVLQALGAPDNIKRGPRGSKKEEWTYNAYALTVSVDGDKVTGKSFRTPYNPEIDSTEYHAAQREYTKAVEYLEKATEKDPKDSETLNMLLRAYIESNRLNEAIKAFQTAVKNEPGNKTNHYILGVLYRQVGQFDDAIASFKEALRIDPNDADATFDLGATYYNWGVDIIRAAEEKGETTEAYKEKFEKALPYMEKVSQAKSDDPQVWETLGTIYARLGQQEKALQAFDRADKIRKGN